MLKLSLSRKLTILSAVLVLLPVLAIGIHSIWFLVDFSTNSLQKSNDALKAQALEVLSTAVQNEKHYVESLVQIGCNDAIQLADSQRSHVLAAALTANAGTKVAADDLADEMTRTMACSNLGDSNQGKKLYREMGFIDAAGMTQLAMRQDTRVQGTSVDKEAWFDAVKNCGPGKTYICPVESPDVNQSELRIVSPVYYKGAFSGAVFVSLNWQLLHDIYKTHKFGVSGYPYIVNQDGIVIAHPKFKASDHLKLIDTKYGELAGIVLMHMTKGQAGTARYKFEGVDQFVAFTPLEIGNSTYSVALTSPASEFLTVMGNFEQQAKNKMKFIAFAMIPLMATLAAMGCLVGYKVSKSIADPIRAIIEKLSSGANQVTLASGQLAQSSTHIAEGSNAQASNLEETSASLSQMNSLTKRSAEAAVSANQLAGNSLSIADQGSKSMDQMRDAMNKIQLSSDETAKVIKVIDEIAFQTRMLSLNAAIEAARAGTAGKSFAVVADEVRKLAERCAQASKSTAEMIQSSVANAKEGVQITAKVDSVLEEIINSTTTSARLINEIADSSNQQVSGIDQVTSAVEDMSKVTQQNAAVAEESASLGQELTAQAHNMKDIVNELIAIVEGRTNGTHADNSGAKDWFHSIADGPATVTEHTVESHSKHSGDSGKEA